MAPSILMRANSFPSKAEARGDGVSGLGCEENKWELCIPGKNYGPSRASTDRPILPSLPPLLSSSFLFYISNRLADGWTWWYVVRTYPIDRDRDRDRPQLPSPTSHRRARERPLRSRKLLSGCIIGVERGREGGSEQRSQIIDEVRGRRRKVGPYFILNAVHANLFCSSFKFAISLNFTEPHAPFVLLWGYGTWDGVLLPWKLQKTPT